MEPIPEAKTADDIWKNAFTKVFQNELKDWHSKDEWGKAQVMAREDMNGTGDLLGEAIRNYQPAETAQTGGGVSRILAQIKGVNYGG